MKYFVGIDLGTTNSDRFKSGGTISALRHKKFFSFVTTLQLIRKKINRSAKVKRFFLF